MLVKAGVNLNNNLQREMLPVISAVQAVWDRYGYTPVITDYYRDDPNSLHAIGLALDFRTFDVASTLRETMASEVSLLIGSNFEVILEEGNKRWYYRAGQFNGERIVSHNVAPHMHVEHDRPQRV